MINEKAKQTVKKHTTVFQKDKQQGDTGTGLELMPKMGRHNRDK